MTEARLGLEKAPVDDEGISVLEVGSFLLRWRRPIIALTALGMAAGLAIGLTRQRVYVSSATFLPGGNEASLSQLASAASQLGIRATPTGGSSWGPAVYAVLLRSRALLEPIALDTLLVAEKGGARITVMDLLEIEAATPARRLDATVRKLQALVESREVRTLSAVELKVTTPWPSVSVAIAQHLVRGVNQFNLETRKSQAVAEREFVEVQAAEAARTLRAAEDRLEAFLQQNRVINGGSKVAFERDRLQREVLLRQELLTSLLQNQDEARIRAVRNTPVITVIEEPRLPVLGEPRGSVQKGIIGGLIGALVGAAIAFFSQALSGARREPTDDAREFEELLQKATPGFLRRRVR